MGKSSGGVKNVGSIREIKDLKQNKEVKRAISKYHSRIGLNTKEVKIADLKGAFGVAEIKGNSATVYLDRKSFNNSKEFVKKKKQEYLKGEKVATNSARQHTVIHELAHATWSKYHTSEKHKNAGEEIEKLYKQYKNSKSKVLGRYAKENVNEFYAEGMSQAILGKKGTYSKKLLSITKKYKL